MVAGVPPTEITPPDDTGSETFARFIYQAHVAFPLCLYSASGGDIENIYAEHIEDVALDCGLRWRFLQIKTRDGDRGPWKLSDITASGGAIHSLWRAFGAVGPETAATYELHLEGHAVSKDLIDNLRTPEGRTDAALVARIQDAVGCDEETARTFTSRMVVTTAPVRSSIEAHNLRLLGDQAPALTESEKHTIYDRVIGAITLAMTAGRLGSDWPQQLLTPGDGSAASVLESKRITRAAAQSLFTGLSGHARPLLRRIIDTSPQPSVLEQKLIAGGATAPLIESAKSLRANASIRRFEHLGASMSEESGLLDDVRERLQSVTVGLMAEHSPGPKAAAMIWNRLLERLVASAAVVDPNRIFAQDAHLLLGEVCEMADECLTDWGRDDA